MRRRTKKPLLATEIAEKLGLAKQRCKVGKHFQTEIADGLFEFHRDAHSIEREASLDGLYVIRTSEAESRLQAADVVRSYKQLTRVERAFRCLKTVDLRVRPIRHRKPDRVRAHLLLCLLAYYVEWHLRQALAPLLFADEDLAGLAGAAGPGSARQAAQEPASEEERAHNVGRFATAQLLNATAGHGDALPPSMPLARRCGRAHARAVDRAERPPAAGA